MDNYAYQPDDNTKPFTITGYSPQQRTPNDYLVEVNSRSKFFRKPRFYKTLTGILVVVVLLLVLVVVLLAILNSKNYVHRICTSEECLRSASNLHLSLDFAVSPCEDFYRFTCGRWSAEHPNHGWFPSFSAFATINERILIETESFLVSEQEPDEPLSVKQARNLYASCLDTEATDALGVSVVLKYLREVGLPQVPSLFTKSDKDIVTFSFDWLRADAVIKKVFAMDVLIGFAVAPNLYNRSENVMYVGVPGQRCPLPSPLKNTKLSSNEEVDPDELRKLVNGNIIKFVLQTLIKNVTGEEVKSDALEHATEILINMTFYVDDLVTNYTTLDDDPRWEGIKEYQTKINDVVKGYVNRSYPQIWEKYISYLFENVNVTIDWKKDLLYFGDFDNEYLPKILSYVLTTSDIYLELYMWWVTVFAMIINTSSDIVDFIVKQASPLYTGATVVRTRSLDCSSLVNNFMGMAVSYGVANKIFSNNTKPKVEEMLYQIKNAFVEHVNSLTWMDKETKHQTLEKSREMLSFVGHPEWLFVKGALDIYYLNISVNNDTYLENMMSFIRIHMWNKYQDLRVPNERNWSSDPTTVNAYNSFPDNAINIPMAILSFPIYNLGLEALNYGAIGSVLGHELIHGFDNTGRKHDKYGNYKEWWSNATIDTFEKKIECFVKQYDNYTVEGVTSHVQGKKTLGENLADNGGLGNAYRAYQNYIKRHGSEARLPGFENFTHNQLFFIAFGSIWCETITGDDLETQIKYDEHSPNCVRVLGTLQNSQEFARAFRCPAGSQMNPDRAKCKVW